MTEPTIPAPAQARRASPRPTALLVHLSGDLRGRSQRLQGERLSIGTAPGAEVRLQAHEESVGPEHAVLARRGETYELQVVPGRAVWVNGDRVESRVLENGDLLEVGSEGPVLRFRLRPPGSAAYKSPREAFEDCLDSARYASPNLLGRTGAFLAGMPRQLAIETSVRFRVVVVGALLLLLGGVGYLGLHSLQLERSLESQTLRLRALADLVETGRVEALREEDLERLRREVQGRLSETTERLHTLEARTEAPARVLAMASGSIAFLQGSYGFLDPDTGRPFRLAGLDAEGRPVTDDAGSAVITTEGDGPLLERLYTGTAFVATAAGLLVTNRHIGLPWKDDVAAQAVLRQGVAPVLLRLVGYLPGVAPPFDVEVVIASDSADLAVVRLDEFAGTLRPLELRSEPPLPGEEVLVLGYPTGIQALMARSDERLVRELMEQRRELDFWSLARRLSEAGQIAPLATRGIVGQVTPTTVVYDAQTTFGGSGGPVLDLEGRVVAVNSAVLAGFAGSNMGVPASEARRLLERAAAAPPATGDEGS